MTTKKKEVAGGKEYKGSAANGGIGHLVKISMKNGTAAASLGASEVLIVAPYNAQVDLIRQMLDKAGLNEVAVGTVDKFQGREAMVVIVSLAASSALDAPRGLDFLLDRNRLNVALSRAKANCYLVYSPALTKSRFRNIEELKSVSRLNGLLEQANHPS